MSAAVGVGGVPPPAAVGVGEAELSHKGPVDDDNALIAAVRSETLGSHREVVRLIAEGEPVNFQKPNGVTALFVASQEGHVDDVKALLAARAEVDATTTDGTTPLYQACRKGHDHIVDELILAGADVDRAKANGVTPLHGSCLGGSSSAEVASKLPPRAPA